MRWDSTPYLLPESNFGVEHTPKHPPFPDSLPDNLLLDPVKIGIAAERITKPRKLKRNVTQNESIDVAVQPYPAPIEQLDSKLEDQLNFIDIREALDPSLQHGEFSSQLSDSSPGRRQLYQVKNSTYEELLQHSDSTDNGDYRSYVNDVLT